MEPHNQRGIRANTPRVNSVAYLIMEGLGYCCENFFWRKFYNVPTRITAARLGVSGDTVSRHKKAFIEGELPCRCQQDCFDQYF